MADETGLQDALASLSILGDATAAPNVSPRRPPQAGGAPGGGAQTHAQPAAAAPPQPYAGSLAAILNSSDSDATEDERPEGAPPRAPTQPSPPPAQVPAAIAAFYQLCAARPELAGAGTPAVTVILSPLSYRHVFSRAWLSKRAQSTIVERPERLNACALGIGVARAVVPLRLAESTRRASLFAPHVVAVHGERWPRELHEVAAGAAAKLAAGEVEVPPGWPAGDIYMAPESLAALEAVVGALETGVDTVFDTSPLHPTRRAFVCVRPPGHHCHEDAASGFCLINNAHIAIQYARARHAVTHAVILDFDLHHGDGSQDLCWKLSFDNGENADDEDAAAGRRDPPPTRIGYFSVHDINSFPTERGYAEPEKLVAASTCLAAHGMAVWNVHLEPYNTEAEFHALYETRYAILFRRAAAFLGEAERDARAAGRAFRGLVVVSAGFDGSEFESQGMQRHGVHVPTSFFNRFTLDCGHLADRYCDGRVLSLLEGGYSTQALATGVFSHLTGLHGAAWNPAWTSPKVAEEFLKGSRPKWKASEHWPGVGIQLGRTLFPAPPPKPKEEEPAPVPAAGRLRTRAAARGANATSETGGPTASVGASGGTRNASSATASAAGATASAAPSAGSAVEGRPASTAPVPAGQALGQAAAQPIYSPAAAAVPPRFDESAAAQPVNGGAALWAGPVDPAPVADPALARAPPAAPGSGLYPDPSSVKRASFKLNQ